MQISKEYIPSCTRSEQTEETILSLNLWRVLCYSNIIYVISRAFPTNISRKTANYA
jgi:hypothetical protein